MGESFQDKEQIKCMLDVRVSIWLIDISNIEQDYKYIL